MSVEERRGWALTSVTGNSNQEKSLTARGMQRVKCCDVSRVYHLKENPMRTSWLAMFVGLVATNCLYSPVTAQTCEPFRRAGMRPIRWHTGSTLEVGSTASGPAAIALRFRHDIEFGVVMTSLGHRSTDRNGQVSVHDYASEPTTNKGLWKAIFRAVTSEDPIEVTPDSTTFTTVWVDDRRAPTKAIFRWFGLDLGTFQTHSLFWAELRVAICASNQARSEWQSRIGRIELPFGHGDPVTLDEVHAPIVHVQQPGTASRLLVPIHGAFELPASNLPMGYWANNPITGQPISLELEHPARGQQMQFSAMYSHNPGDSFRKLVYFATEDSKGYYKRYCHTAVPDPGGAFYRWDAVHFPVYGPVPHINYHKSKYPVVISALEACTDSWWYDVTDHYREFVDREMGLTPIASPNYSLNPDFVDASTLVATSIVTPEIPEAAQVDAYDKFLKQAQNLRAWFTGANGQETPTFMEWQKWLQGANDAPLGAENPIGPGYNPRPFTGIPGQIKEPAPYVRSTIEAVQQSGINLSVYTLPVTVNTGDWGSFDPTWLLRDRDGSLYGTGTEVEGRLIDYGYPQVPDWMANEVYDDIMNTNPGLGGMFFDVLGGGGGARLRYPADPGLLFKKRYHGGSLFVEGTQRVFDTVRARIAAGKTTQSHPDIPFLLTETVQEHLAGRYDFGQHGYKSVPWQMQLNPLFDLFGGHPLFLSAEASNPSPPLWHAVYHEYSRAEALAPQLAWTATAFGDVSPAEWGDYMRMVHALWYFQGMKPTTFQYYYDARAFELLVDNDGTVEPAHPFIPQQGQLLTFLRRMHESLDRNSEAGQFLSSGRMERPLLTPNAYFGQSQSPSTPAFKIANSAAVAYGIPGVQHFYENAFSNGTFNLLLLGQPGYASPHVMHSMWRSSGNQPKLGLVMVNWADTPAFWDGIFDPACYDGITNDFVVKGLTPTGTGVTEYMVGQGQGPTTLSWGTLQGIPLQHHSQGAPGFMPPRSIQVFVIESR